MKATALPTPEARALPRAARIVRATTAVAVVALALWVGGLVALGACAAPLVFRLVPAPWSGDAMGAVFRRFDAVAISCAVVVLGCEAVRLWSRQSLGLRPTLFERARGLCAIVAAVAAIYIGVDTSPKILTLHAAGAIRGLGDSGLMLEQLHRVAETLAKIEVCFGVLLLVLHVLTLDDGKEARS